jgi:drug/metabolite transporter (DMT)-like permease
VHDNRTQDHEANDLNLLHMTETQTGILFAACAALCWTISAIAFSQSSRLVGSLPVNALRLVLASLLFMIYGALVRGRALPLDADPHAWLWLSLSGFVGFFLGDLFLFRSFGEIGVRLSMVIMSLAPPIAAAAGWLWLDEHMNVKDIIGMLTTLGGVMWVIKERRLDRMGHHRHVSVRGVVFALLGAMGQGIGLVLGKLGMIINRPSVSEGMVQQVLYDPFAATQIRAYAGLAGFLVLILFLRRGRQTVDACRSLKPLSIISIGAVFGPFLGVAFLMRAVHSVPSGVAQTLTATVPVLIIPLAIVFDKERITARMLWGTLVTVIGVGILAW